MTFYFLWVQKPTQDPKLLCIIFQKSETFSKEVYGTIKTRVSQICIEMRP